MNIHKTSFVVNIVFVVLTFIWSYENKKQQQQKNTHTHTKIGWVAMQVVFYLVMDRNPD